MKNRVKFLVLGVLLFSANGCVTVFSEFQSARTLGEGNKEVTANISGVNYAGEGDNEYHQTNIGVQFGMGLNESADIRFRIENLNLSGESGDNFEYYAVGVGPKISLIRDKMALYVPIGFAFDFGDRLETDETFEIQPTLLYTFPVSEDFEVNTSGKYIFVFEDSPDALRDDALAFNIGLGIFSNSFTVRPEMGFMIYPEDTDMLFFHFGTGVSYNF
ncbi:hypothetical protein [Gracilimonas mengyeensis]|uniref:Outer membrane protein beta-barrel domain-containing protein n=1 Tax=Gracilimonas mengyeensis TaxID=1302730 RepID=A0A521ANL8_9BACT|nr:hypothetical protein [Gracilimonas mengyeensis]SMO36416.1 hypothetical protein SAMN06265219_101276 [Gracilimonas mengyeensis]